jgi:hypothetical protein
MAKIGNGILKKKKKKKPFSSSGSPGSKYRSSKHPTYLKILKFISQSRTGLQIYEGHDDQLNRPAPMA